MSGTLMEKQKAILAALINAIIVGLSFIFVKLALNFTNPVDTLAHRFTLSYKYARQPLGG
jgi:hypothetical protein